MTDQERHEEMMEALHSFNGLLVQIAHDLRKLKERADHFDKAQQTILERASRLDGF